MARKFYTAFIISLTLLIIGVAFSACKNGGFMPTKQGKYTEMVGDVEPAENITEIKNNYLYAVTVKGPLKGNYLLVDCRPLEQFKQQTIPTAVSLSEFKGEVEENLPEDKSTEIIFFCKDSTCEIDARAATMAMKYGYENIKILQGGINGWQEAGFTLTGSEGS